MFFRKKTKMEQKLPEKKNVKYSVEDEQEFVDKVVTVELPIVTIRVILESGQVLDYTHEAEVFDHNVDHYKVLMHHGILKYAIPFRFKVGINYSVQTLEELIASRIASHKCQTDFKHPTLPHIYYLEKAKYIELLSTSTVTKEVTVKEVVNYEQLTITNPDGTKEVRRLEK